MATKNNPGNYDCYENADPDEPMFVLLGRDAMAPSLVESWAYARELDNEDLSKVEEARACAASMREWLKKLGKDEKPITAVGSYIWRATIYHGATKSDNYITTAEQNIAHAVAAAESYANDEEQFLPGAEVRSVEFVGVVAA